MYNQKVKDNLLAYYEAYRWANGQDKAKRLRLSYKKGWYYISSYGSGIQFPYDAIREKELKQAALNLWARNGFINALKEIGKES